MGRVQSLGGGRARAGGLGRVGNQGGGGEPRPQGPGATEGGIYMAVLFISPFI